MWVVKSGLSLLIQNAVCNNQSEIKKSQYVWQSCLNSKVQHPHFRAFNCIARSVINLNGWNSQYQSVTGRSLYSSWKRVHYFSNYLRNNVWKHFGLSTIAGKKSRIKAGNLLTFVKCNCLAVTLPRQEFWSHLLALKILIFSMVLHFLKEWSVIICRWWQQLLNPTAHTKSRFYTANQEKE